MKKRLSPYVIIPLSLVVINLIGTLILYLPISHQETADVKFVDAFLLSTSALTVTGLTSIMDISITFNTFGKVVIAVLIQIGGLSVITIGVFLMILIGTKINISNRLLIKESMNQVSAKGAVKLVKNIVLITLFIEFIGFVLNLFIFMSYYPFWEAVGYSAFHSISTFNNAGLDIFGSQNMILFSGEIILLIISMIMIMIGGLGYVVIYDILTKRRYKKLSIHSKIVLKVNLCLWLFGFVMFMVGQLQSNQYTPLEAMFLSVSARTAGFKVTDMTSLSTLSIVILVFLMFIGGSPSSTAGGIKTTSLYVIYKSIKGYAFGKKTITYNRYIADESRYKVYILVTSMLAIIFTSIVVILIIQPLSLEEVLVEAVSAITNTGLSMDTTQKLYSTSKVIISLLMLVGRVGPLTVLLIFNRNWPLKESKHVKYLEERIMIG